MKKSLKEQVTWHWLPWLDNWEWEETLDSNSKLDPNPNPAVWVPFLTSITVEEHSTMMVVQQSKKVKLDLVKKSEKYSKWT